MSFPGVSGLTCDGLLVNLVAARCGVPDLVTCTAPDGCLDVVDPRRTPLGDFLKTAAACFCPIDFEGDAGRDRVVFSCEVVSV